MNLSSHITVRRTPVFIRCDGFTLTELLVAMTLSLGIVAGALQLFGIGLNAWRTVEATASLEERLSFALQAIEADLLLAGYRGESHLTGPQVPASARCRGRDVSPWALALDQPFEAHNNPAALPCPVFAGIENNSDALVVRHHDAMSETLIVQTHGWYIDRASSLPGQPSLRRQTLLPDGSVQNQEIIPGIENMQITLGIDRDGDRLVDEYVEPDGVTDPVLTVRVEIRARAAVHENGIGGDGFRRVTAQRTVFLRNV